MEKILIVDDDADLREAIESVLSGKYEVRTADGKASALALLQTYTPALVILDVMMETTSSGFELAREIKSRAPAPRILMLTGVDKEMGIDFKSEAGDAAWLPVDDYITKPLQPALLLEKVAALVE